VLSKHWTKVLSKHWNMGEDGTQIHWNMGEEGTQIQMLQARMM
jgi:hypothetical protein